MKIRHFVFSFLVCLFLIQSTLQARTVEIGFWTKNDPVDYRNGSILLAAKILNEELKIEGSDIQVVIKVQSWQGGKAWGALKQAFSLAMEAGTGPNIILSGHEDIAVWGKAGLIQPIEDLVNLDAWPLNDVVKSLWTPMTWNGKIWAVPQDAESRPLYFWIENLKKIGYSNADLEALPGKIIDGSYTLYDVLKDAKKIQDKGLVKKGYGFYPRPKKGGDYWQFYRAFGGEMYDSKTGMLVLDKKALLAYYQFFHDAAFKYGVTSKNHIGTEWSNWHKAVTSGRVGIWHGGTWQQAEWVGMIGLDAFEENVGFALIPAGKKGFKATTLTHPLAYMVSKSGEEKTELSVRLIAIATEPRINSLHAIKSSHLAVTKSQSTQEFYLNNQWLADTSYLLNYAFSLPNNADFGQYDVIVWNGLTATWSGRSTPQEAAASVVREMKATMSDKVLIR